MSGTFIVLLMTFLFLMFGCLLLRFADRVFLGLLFQDPPRNPRADQRPVARRVA